MHKKRGMLLLLMIFLLVFAPALAQTSDISKCKNVKYTTLCYTLAAQSEKNEDLCDEIVGQKEREQCKEIVDQSNNKYPNLVFSSAIVATVFLFAVSFYILRKKSNAKTKIGKIADYITKWKANGYDDSSIKNTLTTRGFSKDEVEKAYSRIGSIDKR